MTEYTSKTAATDKAGETQETWEAWKEGETQETWYAWEAIKKAHG